MSDANKTRSGNTWPSSGGSTTGNIGTGTGQRPGSGTQGMSDTA